MNGNVQKSLKELVSSFVVGEKEMESLSQIYLSLNNNPKEFNNLISSMESFFVNSNDLLRKNSHRLLSLVIEKSNMLQLSTKEFMELFDFSVKKLKDVVCVNSSLKILFCMLS